MNKPGVKKTTIDEATKQEAVKLIKLRVPMKYVGVICGISLYFVKRIMKEEGLEEEYKQKKSAETSSTESL